MPPSYDAEQFRDNFEHGFTWLAGFMRNARRFFDHPAMYDPDTDRRWTYGELNAEANMLAHALRGDGVGKGDLCMYMLLNSPEFAFCYLATHKLGAISCPINFRLSASEIALLIDDSRPKVFFTMPTSRRLRKKPWPPPASGPKELSSARQKTPNRTIRPLKHI